MKRLYVSLGLIALMAALSGLHIWRLSGLVEELTGLLTQAQEQVELENWEEAARLTRRAQDRWADQDGYLHFTLRHADTDAIQISMEEVLAKTATDSYFRAEEAVSFGLADQIITSLS